MDYGVMIALGSLALAAVLVAAVVGGALALGRQHERNLNLREGGPSRTDARLARIERLLESLSTDVERLSSRGDAYLPPKN